MNQITMEIKWIPHIEYLQREKTLYPCCYGYKGLQQIVNEILVDTEIH